MTFLAPLPPLSMLYTGQTSHKPQINIEKGVRGNRKFLRRFKYYGHDCLNLRYKHPTRLWL